MARFIRITGQVVGVEQEEPNPFGEIGSPPSVGRQHDGARAHGIRAFLPTDENPSRRDPTYDPLSDWLDEPFPEEMR